MLRSIAAGFLFQLSLTRPELTQCTNVLLSSLKGTIDAGISHIWVALEPISEPVSDELTLRLNSIKKYPSPESTTVLLPSYKYSFTGTVFEIELSGLNHIFANTGFPFIPLATKSYIFVKFNEPAYE